MMKNKFNEFKIFILDLLIVFGFIALSTLIQIDVISFSFGMVAIILFAGIKRLFNSDK